MQSDCCTSDHFWRAARYVVLAMLAVLFTCEVTCADESRTWTDITGKFTIVGKLASKDAKMVRIEKSNGQVVAIPIDKLCKTDQEFLTKAVDANPFQPVEESPFQPEAPAAMNEEADDNAGPVASGEPREIRINYNALRTVEMEARKEGFGIEASAVPEIKLRTRPIPVPPTFDFFDGVDAMKVSGNGRVLISYDCELKHAVGHIRIPAIPANQNRPQQGRAEEPRVLHMTLVDGVSGKLLSESHYVGEAYKLLALHDDGIRFAVRNNKFGTGNSRHLEIWAFNGPKSLVRGFRLTPFDDAKWDPDKEIGWAEFAGDRLLVGRNDRMMAINIADGRPQYQIPISNKPVITADKKYAIFFHQKHLAALEVATGKIACAMPFEATGAPVLGINPTGTHLVCLANNQITKINLQNGIIETQFPITFYAGRNDEIIVLNERYILSPRGELCDLQNQIKLWSFSGADRIAHLGDKVVFYKSEGDDNNGAVICQELPGDALAAHLEATTKQPGFFVVEPGVKVRLDVEGITDGQKRGEVLASLFKQLEANGNIVDPDGEITLKASVESRGPKEVSFWGFGNQKVTFQEYYSKLEFVYQGKTAWSTSGNNIPGMLHYDRSEGLQAAAAKYNHPNYYLFENATIPRKVAKPTNRTDFGSTRVTVSGLQ